MKKFVSGASIVLTSLVLAGCNSGITYGTGETHEMQTLKGLSTAFKLTSPENKKIDYESRPDLVMPANKGLLPTPATQSASEINQDWPETPAQRLAAVRGQAPEPNDRGELPTAYLTDTNKTGIRRAVGENKSERLRDYKTSQEGFFETLRKDKSKGSEGAEARRLKENLSYAKDGATRKFLTEPPNLYRTPSASAEAGDTGISKEEITAREKQQQKEDRAKELGTLLPN